MLDPPPGPSLSSRYPKHGCSEGGAMNKQGSFAKLLARLRTGTCVSLFGLTILGGALAAPPVWAPEDPWRVVAEIPAIRGHQAAAAEMLAGFLDRAGIRLSP